MNRFFMLVNFAMAVFLTGIGFGLWSTEVVDALGLTPNHRAILLNSMAGACFASALAFEARGKIDDLESKIIELKKQI